MSNITVSSTAALNSALTSAHDGDTILLSAGTYDGMQANNLNFASGITITSADAAHQAVLTNFDMNNDHGVTLSNLELATKGTGYFVFNIIGSSNIHLDHLNIHGSMDGNATDDIEGVAVVTSDNVSITNSEFQQLERALLSNTTTNLTIANNYIHDVEVTGIVMANVSHINITGNAFSNFFPLDGEHPDAIQFETAGTTVASHDINITNNAIYLGTGQPTQGIFFRDQVGTLQYTNVNIANNLIDGTGYGGIAVGHVNNLTVSNNQLLTFANGYTTPLQIDTSDHVMVTSNQATSMAFGAADGNTNVTQSGNVTTLAVTDGGAAALQSWIASHTVGTAAPTTPVAAPPTAPVAISTPGVVLTGLSNSSVMTGGAGNDTIDGGGGFDTLSGAAGDDTYIVPNGQALVVELPGGGNDTVIAKGDYTLPANVENLIINPTVSNSWLGTGNALNNQITGNAGANLLNGAAGNDTIVGGAGSDTLFGGVGDDRLTGGVGADSFSFAPGGGHDVITDYGVGADKIDIYPYQVAGLRPTLHDVGSDVVISFTNGDTISVLNHHAADLHAYAYGWFAG